MFSKSVYMVSEWYIPCFCIIMMNDESLNELQVVAANKLRARLRRHCFRKGCKFVLQAFCMVKKVIPIQR